MPTIEVKAIIVRCRVESCFHNEDGFCTIEPGKIAIDLNTMCLDYDSGLVLPLTREK